MNPEPLLSVVVVSRNNDHGGNLLYRMQLFVSGFLEQAKRHNLNSELIIVEWNPPLDRPRLAEVLQWPEDTGPCTVRIIEVPPEIHSRFKHSDRLALFQMIGKNVGIRRARGRFILDTNIDLLYSDELMSFISGINLKKDERYRGDRYNVNLRVVQYDTLQEQLSSCRDNIFRNYSQSGEKSIKKDI